MLIFLLGSLERKGKGVLGVALWRGKERGEGEDLEGEDQEGRGGAAK